MYSPKRKKLSGFNRTIIEEDDIYPPAALAKDGISPYYMGKPDRKLKRKKKENSDGEPVGSSHLNILDDRTDEEIVIEEDESPDLGSKKEKTKSIRNFLFGNVNMQKIKSSPEMANHAKKPTKKFDFTLDPTVNSIRDSICDIIDPSGAKRTDPVFMQRMAEKAAEGMEKAAEPHKRSRKKNNIQAINGVYPSFTTANGQDVHKSKFVNPLSGENSARSNCVSCSRSSSVSSNGPQNKPNMPEISKRTSTNGNSMVKKAMGMDTNGGGKDEVLTGLRAEPTLKNFDENIINLIESEIMSMNTEISWTDVAGLEGAKKALREIVVLPFKRPDVFTGIRAPPKGVLLFGPPGTGKTMIGRCVASQCKATFFNISASSLTSKWVGEGEKLVRALFAVARVKLPSVIFIDEIDSLLSARSESEHESSRRIKTEFLVQLDGVATAPDERLLVLGATNRPQELDEAARRRFAKRLYIALPESESRCQIVKNLLRGTKNDIDDAILHKISEVTDGYSGADMKQLCSEAAMGPIRDIGDEIETIQKEDIRSITLRDFLEAARVVRPTVDDSQLDAYAAWDKKFGCLIYKT